MKQLRERIQVRSFLWSIPTLTALVYIVTVRESGGTPIVPFLMLYSCVVIASFGGSVVGTFGGLAAAGFVVYSTAVDFGPESLTGGPLQAVFGCMLFTLTGQLLGRVHDQNHRLLGELANTRDGLESTIAERTQELGAANNSLLRQIGERDEMRAALVAFEAKMHHTQRLESIGVLAGGIAHDFNNLLTSILGNASVLREDLGSGEPRELVDAIAGASSRAADLCRQILLYAGETDASLTTFELGNLFRTTIGFVTASVSKKIDFQLECPDEILVHGDESQMGQVVLNLLTNAADAIDDVGTVRTRLRVADLGVDDISDFLMAEHLRPGPSVWIEVTDDGAGMTTGESGRIFDPFYSTKVDGRGLGLAVVFGVARAHAAGLRVMSEVGIGTTVYFVMPFQDLDDRDQSSATLRAHRLGAGASAGPDAARTGLIVLADDDAAIRRLSVKILERAGWTVVAANNGAEAVEHARTHPDAAAVVLDLTMPVMDGREASEELARLDSTLPVVLMSGYSRDISELPAHVSFLQKPFTAGQLSDIVTRVARSTPGPPR